MTVSQILSTFTPVEVGDDSLKALGCYTAAVALVVPHTATFPHYISDKGLSGQVLTFGVCRMRGDCTVVNTGGWGGVGGEKKGRQ